MGAPGPLLATMWEPDLNSYIYVNHRFIFSAKKLGRIDTQMPPIQNIEFIKTFALRLASSLYYDLQTCTTVQ